MEERKGMHWFFVLLISIGAMATIYFFFGFIQPRTLSASLKLSLWSSHIANFTGFMLCCCLARRRYFDSTGWRVYLILCYIVLFTISGINSIVQISSYIGKYDYYSLRSYDVSEGVRTLAVFLTIAAFFIRIAIYHNLYRRDRTPE